MLKKAGIVVAAAAAGLLAVSPLAFAGDKGDDHHSKSHHSKSHHERDHDKRHDGDKEINKVEGSENKGGLINVSENNVAVAVNDCDVNNPTNIGAQPTAEDALVNVIGVLGLFNRTEGHVTNVTDQKCIADAETTEKTKIKQKIDD